MLIFIFNNILKVISYERIKAITFFIKFIKEKI